MASFFVPKTGVSKRMWTQKDNKSIGVSELHDYFNLQKSRHLLFYSELEH